MRIRRLTINNFQSIAKAQIKFTEGLNVIVGENGLGKSAILRALLWACRDAYRGTWFAKDGSSSTKVIVQTRKDMKVIREIERSIDDDGKTKTLKTNRYRVVFKDEDKKPVTFDKFKSQPPEIVNALGISEPIVLGPGKDETIDLNFADQHRDAIFLINKPGSLAAKLLSHTIGIEPVLRGMRLVATERRNVLQDVKRVEGERDELDTAIKEFPADNYKSIFAKLDSKVVAVRELGQLYKHVDELGNELKEIVREGKVAQAQRSELKDALELPWDETQTALKLVIDIQVVWDELTEAEAEIKIAKQEFNQLGGQVDSLGLFVNEWGNVVPAMVGYNDAVYELDEAEEDNKQVTVDYNKAKKGYDDYLHELGVCPTCGQDVV